MQFLALLRDSLRESRDRKTFWVMLAISAFVAIAMASMSFAPDAVHLGFGAWTIKTTEFSPLSPDGRSRIAALLISGPLEFFLGTIGVLLMIVATAGMFPSMMEHGAIDVVLAKPINRPKLFLYKYATGLSFAAIQSAVFVVLTFVVMGVRWGVWMPGYLVSVILMTLLFSYLYCVSVFVSVRTKSTIAAILLTVAAWIVFAAPSIAIQVYESKIGKDSSNTYRSMKAAAWVFPKTTEIAPMAAKWVRAGTTLDVMPKSAMQSMSRHDREQMDRIEREMMDTNPWVSIGTSLLFEAVVVLWSMWTFTRRDF